MKILLSIFPMLLLGSSCAWMFKKDPHPNLLELEFQQQESATLLEKKVTESSEAKPEKAKLSTNYPTAVALPGRLGMVFSPYNNRVIDCVGMRSGSLVMDPQYPREEKKWFLVP